MIEFGLIILQGRMDMEFPHQVFFWVTSENLPQAPLVGFLSTAPIVLSSLPMMTLIIIKRLYNSSSIILKIAEVSILLDLPPQFFEH